MGIALKAMKLIPIFLRLGFRIVRQVGSHVHLEHFIDKTRKITIPVHNKDLPIKTLKSILRQAKISTKEFLQILGR